MRADDLLAAVFPDQAACGENIVGDIRIPDHPLVNETMRDCLTEAMDLERLKDILGRMERGDIELVAIDTAEPSPFSHEILNANPCGADAPHARRRRGRDWRARPGRNRRGGGRVLAGRA
jgi:ATP-dependent Lhr-like helicase